VSVPVVEMDLVVGRFASGLLDPGSDGGLAIVADATAVERPPGIVDCRVRRAFGGRLGVRIISGLDAVLVIDLVSIDAGLRIGIGRRLSC
jgi:hypothetical protein